MISYLRGKIITKIKNYVIIDVNSIGYKVFVSSSFYDNLKIGNNYELYIYQQISEQTNSLFGFKNIEELDFYELLLTVSGIGPKTALSVMNQGNINDIKNSIYRGNNELLSKITGIGKKTSERIVLELKNKIATIGEKAVGAVDNFENDEIEALMSLGYSAEESLKALRSLSPEIKNKSDRIKKALNIIGSIKYH